MPVTAEKSGQETKEAERANEVKERLAKVKGKLNSVENSSWQEGWLEAGTSHREQGEEHADGWWNEEHVDGWWKDEQTGSSSSSGWWMTANDQTTWESEGPAGGFEINSVEPKYIKHDRWGQEWLMLSCDSGASVTALLVAVAGDPPLEKRGEFRVASGAFTPNLGKIKMKSTDESGVARSIRGHITEVAKPLLSAAEVSKRWDSLLFQDEGILLERTFLVALEVRAILKKHKVWKRHGKSIRLYREGNLYNAYVRVVAMSHRSLHWLNRGELDQDGRGRWRSDEQDEANQLEELRRVSAARQPTELERQRSIFTQLYCVRTLVRSVCTSKRNRSTTPQTHSHGTGKATTGWTQNLLRLPLHVGGMSCYSDACDEIQQIRQDSCHSVGAEGLDAVGG